MQLLLRLSFSNVAIGGVAANASSFFDMRRKYRNIKYVATWTIPIRKITMLIIHCAATRPKQAIGARDIDIWHKRRGWRGIGYHYVIRRDGKIEKGRPIGEVGAHATGFNQSSIGICLVGGIDDTGKPESNYTPAQWNALKELVSTLKAAYNIPSKNIIGHNQVSNKACPCFNVPAWVRENGL